MMAADAVVSETCVEIIARDGQGHTLSVSFRLCEDGYRGGGHGGMPTEVWAMLHARLCRDIWAAAWRAATAAALAERKP